MWLPWEEARLRSWADELERAGELLGDRIKRSLDVARGSSLGGRAKLSLEANRVSQRGVGLAAVELLRELREFEAVWERGVIERLQPRLYADELSAETETAERLYRLLREPVARFVQELALPRGWTLGAHGSTPSLISVLDGAGLSLRVLRLGEGEDLRAYRERQAPGPAGVAALAAHLNAVDREGARGQALDRGAIELVHPSRGLMGLYWHDLVMPLWSAGPADNPTRLARLNAWLDRPEPTATTLALVARGLWDRSSKVRQRALAGLGELGLAAAALIPELLRVRRDPSGWASALHRTLDRITEDPRVVEAFAPRLRADQEAHLRWLRSTRSVGAKAAIPGLTRALAIVPVAVEHGQIPPEWRRREWRELVGHLRAL